MIRRTMSLLLCTAVLLGLLSFPASASASRRPGAVTTSWGSLNVRKSPSTSADIVCTVEKGYPFKYLSKQGKWIQVKDEPVNAKDGVCKGWVYNANLWGFFKQ